MQRQTSSDEVLSTQTTVGVALVSVLTLVFSSGVFTVWSMMIGLVLLLVLLAYSRHGEGTQTRIEHVASSALLSYSCLLVLGWLVQPWYIRWVPRNLPVFVLGGIYFSLTWAVVACVLWFLGTLFWMKISPRQLWPKLYQRVA